MTSYYLNTDLCLVSRADLTPLVESVKSRVELLHFGKHGRKWFASFEATGSGQPGKRKPLEDISRLLKVCDSLKGKSDMLLKGCLSREMNVGWQAAEQRPEGSFQLDEGILLRMAELKIGLAVTVYPSNENDISDFKRSGK